MAWSTSAQLLMWVLAFHSLSQNLAVPNHTRILEKRFQDVSEGKSFTERINPNSRDLHSLDIVLNPLYLSPSIFRSNYDQMLESFKIYIYPRKKQDFGSPEWCSDQRFRDYDKMGSLFYEILMNSEFITDDPEKAHLFFLPFSVDAQEISSSVGVSRFLRRYIDDLRSEYPYWNRTLGADHFYISCGGIEIDSSRNVVELKKNAIQISCYPLGNGHFYPHKDMSMPPLGSVIAFDKKLIFQGSETRSILAYHVGSLEGIPGIESVVKQWKSDPDFVLDPVMPEGGIYTQRLSSSSFCLNFLGHSGNLSIWMDALASGCIPVIICQGPLLDFPFQDILNWQEFTILTNMRRISDLKQTLLNIPKPKVEKMRSLSVEGSKHLRWQSTPQPYDAFYSLIYQLWLRRHTIRYVRRHVSS